MVLILGCGVLANRLFVWLDHARYVIITKRLMAYAGPSSNGRTLVFGTSYVGSNPAGPAIYLRMKTAFGRFFVALLVYALILVRERLVLGGIRPIAAISQSQKQKTELFCNFFAIRDSPSLLQSGKEPSYSHFCCILGLNPRLRKSRQSLIAKKLQSGAIFCFWASGPASRRCSVRDA